ncbi:MAG: flagellar basal body rod protein FlgC [Nitrospinaceae bacterium]
MDFLTSMKISSSGLAAQRKRMEVISSNLANLETTRTPEGGPYRRKDVVISALPLPSKFNALLKDELTDHLRQVAVTGIAEDQTAPTLVYNPDHPDADERGYVKMPNINLVKEMVNLINASRSFEANIQAVNTAKSMAQRAIELGR